MKKIRYGGGSLRVPLTKELESIGAGGGDRVRVILDGNKIVIEKVRR